MMGALIININQLPPATMDLRIEQVDLKKKIEHAED
jgi:hypothetical protein